jgi:polysaccharide export outer membrane protein
MRALRLMIVVVCAGAILACKSTRDDNVSRMSEPGSTRIALDEGPPDPGGEAPADRDDAASGSSELPPPPPESPLDQKLQPGDYVLVELSGVPLPERREDEFRLTESGTVSMPYLDPIDVIGRTPLEVAADLEEAYRANEIYTNPKVRVSVNRDYVDVKGRVRSPRRVTFSRGLTFLSAIAAAGGFSEDANRREVLVRRSFRRYTVDAVLAAQESAQDPSLQPGDVIEVSAASAPQPR